MTDITLIFPEQKMDALSEHLVGLTEAIEAVDRTVVAHGFLGGSHGYGGEWENDTFMMRPYCWCESPECPWCGGCDCTTFHTIDGKRVSLDEWMAFFEREAGRAPISGSPAKFRAWEVRAEEVNKRRGEEVEGEPCDYCTGRGLFATNGAHPGKGSPNFWHKPSGLKVWWYKWIGRSMEVIGSAPDLDALFAECRASLVPARLPTLQGGGK